MSGLNINDYKSSGGGSNYTPEEGIQKAVIVQVVGLGLQKIPPYKGQEKEPAHKVRITYELIDEVRDFDGTEKPLIVSEEFKISSDERSNCFKRLNSIDPGMKKTGGDLTKLVGAPVILTISHKEGEGKHAGKTFTNIDAVTKAKPKDGVDTDTFNDQFSYTPEAHDDKLWDKLPDFVKEKIQSRLDKDNTQPDEPEFDDDIPFEPDSEGDGGW